MAVPQFQFESLLRYRKSRRDLSRQLLAQVLADDRFLAARRLSLEEIRDRQIAEFRENSVTGCVDIDALTARRNYAGQLAAEIRAVDHQRSLLCRQLDLCRQALVKADQEVKVLEKLAERDAAEHRQQADCRERLDVEEAWHTVHRTAFAKIIGLTQSR
jgi:flagellar export protein FliJ